MIIFDLDGTLADCEHRRHFVNPEKDPEADCFIAWDWDPSGETVKYLKNGSPWKPDWKSFYEACDKDTLIEPVCEMLYNLCSNWEIEIWSGRCESVREKTFDWLVQQTWLDSYSDGQVLELKMRPQGNTEPDEVLKERWLDEALAQGKKVDFVFDDRPKVVRMWRRRGIFVFNCSQHDEEF